MGIIIIGIILILYVYYKPYIDITDTSIILWYNKNKERVYKILWERS